MDDVLRRTVRTFIQAFIGTLMVALIPFLNDAMTALLNAEPYVWDFTVLQNIGLAAILSGVIALVTFLHNEVEQKTDKTIITK